MTKKTFLAMHIILILITVLLVCCGKKQTETTITGVVINKRMDESGNVTAVSIDVELEGSYVYYSVIMDEKGRELTRQIDNTVTVTGFVQEDIVKNKSIQVTHWELIKEYIPPPKKK
jgi:hypothetical protein